MEKTVRTEIAERVSQLHRVALMVAKIYSSYRSIGNKREKNVETK